MGRSAFLASTNIKVSEMYSSGWRSIQESPYNLEQNFSLCKYIDSGAGKAFPYVIGTTTSQNTNLGMGKYFCCKGYSYYLRIRNTSAGRGTVSTTWSGVSTPIGPDSDTFPRRAPSTSYGTSNSTPALFPYQFLSGDNAGGGLIQTNFTLSATANSGYVFDGWYTAAIGGTQITTSTSYNVFYTNTYLVNNNDWYAKWSVAPTPTGTSTYLGVHPTNSSYACSDYYSGPNLYYVSSVSNFTYIPQIYRNSSLTLSAPRSKYYSNGAVVRYYGPSGFQSTAFCNPI